jgi:hypothetical protein
MPQIGTGAHEDGESLLVTEREGRWRAEGVDRIDLVAEAATLDALRPAIIEAARARRSGEGLVDRPWKVAYLWGIDVAPEKRGFLGSLGSMLRGERHGPVLEVSATDDGYLARAEDGTAISAATLSELNGRARAQHAPYGADTKVETITLFEVVEVPPEVRVDDGR